VEKKLGEKGKLSIAYKNLCREAAACVCSNYTGLNMAIAMGFGDMK
jgi:ribosomal protein L14E/L6E/L27E